MRTSILGLLALSLAACSESTTPAPLDAGRTLDGGRDAGATDAGGSPDGGRPDSGTPVDGGRPTDAGRDARILPPRDAGMPFGDAGALGPPPWVDLDVRTDGTMCTPLAACGGAIEGTWDVAGGCLEVPFPSMLMACPGATFTGSGRARGRVTFAMGTATRRAQSEVTLDIFVPSFCAMFVSGGCMGIESMIRSGGSPDSACPTDPMGNCNCQTRVTYELDDTDGYTIMGTQIVSATLGKRWDYCVDAATTGMLYEDADTDPMTREPGIIELSRR